MHIYHKSRHAANKRYYSKEENKQKKRDYMREYAKREYVRERRRKYYQKYNANPINKRKRHEWYIKKKIRDYAHQDFTQTPA